MRLVLNLWPREWPHETVSYEQLVELADKGPEVMVTWHQPVSAHGLWSGVLSPGGELDAPAGTLYVTVVSAPRDEVVR